jgi:hypothetical protein
MNVLLEKASKATHKKCVSIANVPEGTHRELRQFAVRNGFSMALALEVLVNVGKQAEQKMEASEAGK